LAVKISHKKMFEMTACFVGWGEARTPTNTIAVDANVGVHASPQPTY